MTRYNRNFAKLENGVPSYGPIPLLIVTHHHDEGVDEETQEPWSRDWDTTETVMHPNADDYARAGYKPVEDKVPSEPPAEGYHYEPRGWEEQDGKIVRVYTQVADPPPPPRRWTRLAIKSALADAHLLPAVQEYLTALLVKPDYPAWAALSDCNYVEENYGGAEAWNALLDGAATALGKTREEINAFLDAIPTEV